MGAHFHAPDASLNILSTPRVRPKSSKNNLPSPSEKRIKKLIIKRAYRTIAVLE